MYLQVDRKTLVKGIICVTMHISQIFGNQHNALKRYKKTVVLYLLIGQGVLVFRNKMSKNYYNSIYLKKQ